MLVLVGRMRLSQRGIGRLGPPERQEGPVVPAALNAPRPSATEDSVWPLVPLTPDAVVHPLSLPQTASETIDS
jgi:hypothetical protein